MDITPHSARVAAETVRGTQRTNPSLDTFEHEVYNYFE